MFAMFRLNILFVKICTNVIAHNFQHSEKPLGEAIMVIVPADVVAQKEAESRQRREESVPGRFCRGVAHLHEAPT